VLAEFIAAGFYHHEDGQILEAIAVKVAQLIPGTSNLEHFCLRR
jgi:hypothetical protein